MTAPNIARLHISLPGTNPLIWRRVDVALSVTLQDLHDVIQAVLPWEDCHLFQFEIGDAIHGLPDPEAGADADLNDVAATRLESIVAAGVVKFTYIYDLGDDWRHDVAIESLAQAVPKVKYPHYIDGAHRAPPEDVGGAPGFARFLKTIAKGSKAARGELFDWYGGEYDPGEIDRDEIEDNLADLARPVTAGKRGRSKNIRGKNDVREKACLPVRSRRLA